MRMILAVLAVTLLLSGAAARAQPAPSLDEIRHAVDQANEQTTNDIANRPAMMHAGASTYVPQGPQPGPVTLGNGVSGRPGEESFERHLQGSLDQANRETTAHILTQPTH